MKEPGNAEHQLGNESNKLEPIPPETEWYSRGYIPHRDKLSLLQSITFRLADCLPQKVLHAMEEELKLVDKDRQELVRRIKIEEWLDSGLGCCALKHPEIARVLEEGFLRFDGKKYLLLAWCIMPNHVHVLIEPLIGLGKIVQSWKSFTGRFALSHNAEYGLDIPGKSFWMRDYWDRYIRDENHLNIVIDYIHRNPVKAGLCVLEEDWLWSSAGIKKLRSTEHQLGSESKKMR